MILKSVSKDEIISWGGSITIDELGIKNILKENNYKLIDRDSAETNKEKEDLIIKSITSDVFLMNTPCTSYGSCADCKTENSICSNILITRLSCPKNRITVIIVNEELGF